MRESNFTNSQRAEIFVLDRATCAYTGSSLWVLDYGLDPICQVDWVDHLQPSSKGGLAVIENGVASSWLVNKLRNNSKQWPLLFYRGIPTGFHAQLIKNIDPTTANNLIRFKNLHVSDWYLNRAIWHVLAAVHIECISKDSEKEYARGFQHYSNAAIKMLDTWHRLVEKSSVPSIEKRKLIERRLEPDQKAMLSIREAGTASNILKLMKELLPIYEEVHASWFMLSQANDQIELIDQIIEGLKTDTLIPKRLLERNILYAQTLKKII